jgi:uncharacterized protein (TIGR03437 family)
MKPKSGRPRLETLFRSLQLYLLKPFFLSILCLAPVTWAQTTSGYTISTVAGTGTVGYTGDGGAATAAEIGGPTGLWFDGSGNLFFVDNFNQLIREVSTSGTISTVAGTPATPGYSGDGKAATKADISGPSFITVDPNGGIIYFSDTANNVIRSIISGNINTFAGDNALGAGYNGDLEAAIDAQLFSPEGLAVDSAGNLYIGDTGNNRIRVVQKDGSSIDTYAGKANGESGFFGDGGPAFLAELFGPHGIAFDAAGNLYVADTGNQRVRKIDTHGIITTVAGSSSVGGYAGDGGPATSALLYNPTGVSVDSAGNLYIADSFNGVIRKVSANGTITTVAGNGKLAFSGDGGSSTDASLNFPNDVRVNGGKVYIADTQNNVIRVLTPILTGAPVVSAVGNASAFGGGSTIADGSFIEIYGSNLAASTRGWASADFNGSSAPSSLDGVTVTIGGEAAFVSYISPTQINALVPSSVGLGSQTLTVSTSGGTSAAFTVNVNATQPGFYAPASLNSGGKQYVGAFLTDFTTQVTASQPVKPGQTIILFGTGFGSVTPASPAGQLAAGPSTLTAPVQIFFNQTPATIIYQGLAPGSTGVYQFNVVVPNISSSTAVSLTFSQGGVPGTQTLFTAVN